MPAKIFLLSPAHCGGKRAGFLLNDGARFDLALRIRQPAGVPLGEIFSFLSGIYFRGKLAYANCFASPPEGINGALAITTNRGLIAVHTRITLPELRALGCVDIDSENPLYRKPLERDAAAIESAAPGAQVILLGSVATGKYVDVLSGIFGERLLFPEEFVGRGDMSRGGLMLRCVAEGNELKYVPVLGAKRRGRRPPKLSKFTAAGAVQNKPTAKARSREESREERGGAYDRTRSKNSKSSN